MPKISKDDFLQLKALELNYKAITSMTPDKFSNLFHIPGAVNN